MTSREKITRPSVFNICIFLLLTTKILFHDAYARTDYEVMDLTKEFSYDDPIEIPDYQIPKGLKELEIDEVALSNIVPNSYMPNYTDPRMTVLHHGFVKAIAGDDKEAADTLIKGLEVVKSESAENINLIIDEHEFLRRLQDDDRPFGIFGELLAEIANRVGIRFTLEIEGIGISGESFFRVADENGEIIMSTPLADSAQTIRLLDIGFGDSEQTIGDIIITDFSHRSILTVTVD